MTQFPAVIAQFLRVHGIDAGEHRILIAVSGGADSMALLHAFSSLYTREEIPLSKDAAKSMLLVAHIHHGLREAADKDADFVREQSAHYGLPFLLGKADVLAVAKRDKTGIEAAARSERYRLLQEFAKQYHADYIAVAHHGDDLAETFLLNLFRGAGVQGLTGMRTMRGNVIRPFLSADRASIEHYLAKEGVPFITDESNFEDTYTRNRLRNDILPLLREEINAQAVQHVSDAALKLEEAYAYLSAQAEEAYASCRKGAGIDTNALMKLPPYLQGEVLRCLCRASGTDTLDLSAAHITALLTLCQEAKGMRSYRLPHGKKAVRTYDILTITSGETEDTPDVPYALAPDEEVPAMPLPLPQTGETAKTHLPNGDRILVTLSEDKKIITNDSYTKCFDYGTIDRMPVIRVRRTKDRISADRAGALTKRVTRDMMDLKVPASHRKRVLLVASGDDVLWIPGLRYNFRYRVRETTKQVLTIRWIRAEAEANGR